MCIDCNNLCVIKEYIEHELSHTCFFQMKRKKSLTVILNELQTISQNNIIFDEEKMFAFNEKQIELYLRRVTLKNINFEIAFNVNAIYEYLLSNNCPITRIDVDIFRNYYSKKDVDDLLNEYKKNEIAMSYCGNYFAYKEINPIIALGSLSDNYFNGMIINGNHRIAKKIASNEKMVDIYIIDCLDHIPNEFLLNDDYRKILYITNKISDL